MRDRAELVLTTSLAPCVWGTTYVVASELLPPGRPLLAATIRALPAGLLLVALGRQLPRGVWWGRAFVLGVLNIAVFNALLFVAAGRLPGGVAATVMALQPLVVAALATRLLGEPPSVRVVLAALAGVGGVALLVLQSEARLDGPGLVAAGGAAAAMALGVVLTKRWASPVPLLAFSGWQLAAGGLLLAPLSLLADGPPPALSASNAAGYAYLAIAGTAIAYPLWFRGVRVLPSASVAVLALCSPLVATVIGWVLLGQQLSLPQLVGAAIVVGAVLVTQVTPRVAVPAPTTVGAR